MKLALGDSAIHPSNGICLRAIRLSSLKNGIVQDPGESFNQIPFLEEMMAEHKSERDIRDSQKSFQATQTAVTDEYRTGIDLFKSVMGCSIEAQKRVLEAASQLNAETVDLWRKMFRNFPGAELTFNLAEQTVENFIGMRRSYLDMMGRQGNEMAESAKTRGERTARADREMTTSSKAA